MRIVVAVKILPDSKDLRAGNDGALDFSHARNVVSEYDLNAIEAGGSACCLPRRIDGKGSFGGPGVY